MMTLPRELELKNGRSITSRLSVRRWANPAAGIF